MYFEGSEYAHSQMQNSTLKKYNGAYHCLHDELPEDGFQILGWYPHRSKVII